VHREVRLAEPDLNPVDVDQSCHHAAVSAIRVSISGEKYRGRKLHEWADCIGGMVRLAVVLYNNYPNVGS
jgi:hypothetical protein